jgi:hypothetical protein
MSARQGWFEAVDIRRHPVKISGSDLTPARI